MSDINVVALTGRITRDPELRHTQSGTPVANTGLAVEGYSKDAEENPVDFVDLTIWSGFAELCNNKLRKGDAVSVHGRLSQSKWQAEDGSNRSKIEVVVNNMTGEFLYRKADGSDTPAREDGDAPAPAASDKPAADSADDDDIPF